MERWTETSDGQGSTTIDVQAIDVARTEAREVEGFKLSLYSLGEEREVMLRDHRGRLYSSRRRTTASRAKGVGMAAVIVGMAAVIVTWLVAMCADVLGSTLSLGFIAGTFVVAALLVAAVELFNVRKGRALAEPVRDRFRLTLGSEGLTVTAAEGAKQTVPLSSIASFEGGRQLAVRPPEGKPIALPLRLPTNAENEALARRLDDALVEARAAGGYRGRGPRIDTRAAATEPAAEAESSAEAESAAEAESSAEAESAAAGRRA